MIRATVRAYMGIAVMAPKRLLAYNVLSWIQLIVQFTSMIIFYYFWQAVYANQTTIAGIDRYQAINYILLAQIFTPIIQNSPIYALGKRVVDGNIAVDLTRPVDIQGAAYVQNAAEVFATLVARLFIIGIVWLLFGLRLPFDLSTWIWFALLLFLGHAALFCFDWILACLAFYTTEVWGLVILRNGIAMFFSGALVPLDMMPNWLQVLTNSLPFAQALYTPIAILSGLKPVSLAPVYCFGQIVWIVVLIGASRVLFSIAIRKISVQGG